MRVLTSTGNTLYYLHSDHLGSASLTSCGAAVSEGGCGGIALGSVVARQSFYPYGAIRPGGTGTMPTDVGFTGQRADASTGLMFYNARYYSPVIGRFISADTIVPGAGDPQALNRFSYALNNPLKYIDPTGHMVDDESDGIGLPGIYKAKEWGLSQSEVDAALHEFFYHHPFFDIQQTDMPDGYKLDAVNFQANVFALNQDRTFSMRVDDVEELSDRAEMGEWAADSRALGEGLSVPAIAKLLGKKVAAPVGILAAYEKYDSLQAKSLKNWISTEVLDDAARQDLSSVTFEFRQDSGTVTLICVSCPQDGGGYKSWSAVLAATPMRILMETALWYSTD